MFNVLHGDCLEVMKDMTSKSVDVAFTSPPYNRKRNDKYKNYNDQIEDYFGFLCDFTDELLRICKGYVFVNVQKNYYQKKDIFKYIGKYANKIAEIVVWEKTNPMPASGKSITNSYEFFICLSDKPLKSNTTYTKNIISTSVNSATTTKIHKAVMKQEVSDWFIEKFTKPEDIVIDPFMGTGTTGVSCRKLHRGFIGVGIDNEYYEIAKERINTAYKENNNG